MPCRLSTFQIVVVESFSECKRIKKELMQLEKNGAAAAVKGDTTFLERHTATNYIGTDPGGGVEDRAQMMAGAKAGNIKFETMEIDDMSVRMGGKDTAVVTGRATITERCIDS